MAFRRADRRRFPRKVKAVLYARTADKRDGTHRCQGCGAPLSPGHFVYDHVVPWEISRDSSIGNGQVICDACDAVKTGSHDIPDIRKSDRVRDNHIGARDRARHPMPGGRASGRSKTMGGRVVPRLTGAQKHARALAARAIATEASP